MASTARFVRKAGTGLLLACIAAGCHQAPYTWVHELPAQREQPASQLIQTGDLVEVRVFGQDSLNTQKKVRQDGTVTVPLVGPIPVTGARPTDVAASLTDRLRPFVNDPRVSVIVHEAPVTISAVGEVSHAGVLELEAPANVLEALAKAGGLSDFARRSRIFVLRAEPNRTQRIRFDYQALLDGDARALSFHMRTGDVLVVE